MNFVIGFVLGFIIATAGVSNVANALDAVVNSSKEIIKENVK
jgi:hypothetical protein